MPPQDVDVLAALDFEIPCSRPETLGFHPRPLLLSSWGSIRVRLKCIVKRLMTSFLIQKNRPKWLTKRFHPRHGFEILEILVVSHLCLISDWSSINLKTEFSLIIVKVYYLTLSSWINQVQRQKFAKKKRKKLQAWKLSNVKWTVSQKWSMIYRLCSPLMG